VVLLLLLIFILQSGQRADVYFLGVHGHLPVGVALPLSTIFGVVLVAMPAVVRILLAGLMACRHRGRIVAAVQRPTEQNPIGEQKPASS
jgi:uncharacterized integral membrane protein